MKAGNSKEVSLMKNLTGPTKPCTWTVNLPHGRQVDNFCAILTQNVQKVSQFFIVTIICD